MKKKIKHAKIRSRKIAINKNINKKRKFSRRSLIELGVMALIALLAIAIYLTLPKIQFAPPDEFRIFVTEKTFDGGFGSIFGADTICTQLAAEAGLPGNNWRAWLGNQYISISEHLDHSELPYTIYDSAGISFTVANNWNDLLDGNINAPINLNQFGETVGSERVWTGTKADGSLSSADCKNWHGDSKVYFGMNGLTSVTDKKWTENSDIDQCGFPRHIYCVQQPEIIQQRIRVFATSDRYDGNFRNYVDRNGDSFSGLTALDALCEDYAANANLNRPDTIGWKAWASDTQTAMKDRYPRYELPFIRLADDVKIADGWADLTDGVLDAPINRDERGAYVDEKVWTHTGFNGDIQAGGNLNVCADWTSNSDQDKAGRGDTTSNTATWTSGDIKSCEDKSRIYCFEVIRANTEDCDDGVDNDGDGLTDCADDYCAGQTGGDGAICEPDKETICGDGGDNDGDGFVDCSDSNCDGLPGPGGQICEYSGETQCSDGSDNDNDGDIDCQDFDCDGIDGCEFDSELTCGDGKDNDADGLIDCADPSCNGRVTGQNGEVCEYGSELNCYDGKDNDADGNADCQDVEDCGENIVCAGSRVFVSNNRYSPDQFGSFSGADSLCQQLAQQAGLSGIWQSWTSDRVNSIADRICQSISPYVLLNGNRVANDWADLADGTLQNFINVDENGNIVSSGFDVWTHTKFNGITGGENGASTACADWTTTDTTIRAGTGRADSITSTWTESASTRCSTQARVFCFEQPPEDAKSGLCSNFAEI